MVALAPPPAPPRSATAVRKRIVWQARWPGEARRCMTRTASARCVSSAGVRQRRRETTCRVNRPAAAWRSVLRCSPLRATPVPSFFSSPPLFVLVLLRQTPLSFFPFFLSLSLCLLCFTSTGYPCGSLFSFSRLVGYTHTRERAPEPPLAPLSPSLCQRR